MIKKQPKIEMKILCVFLLLITSQLVHGQTTSISDQHPLADIQVQFLDQQGRWHRLQKIPNHRYPQELLNVEGKGCAIGHFDISTSGQVKNIKIANIDPTRFSKQLQKVTRQLIRDWRWPEQEQQTKLTMRFDYCYESDKTRDEITQHCITQSEQECD